VETSQSKKGAYRRLLLINARPPNESNTKLAGSGTSEATRNPKLGLVQQRVTLPRCEHSFRPSGALFIRLALPGACAPG